MLKKAASLSKTSLTNTSDKQFFYQLTGLREVAAVMVYIHHFNPFSAKLVGQNVSDFFNEFHIGVSIFFVLSGFLISHRYLNNFDFTKGGFILYFKKRIARIYPMYFLISTVTLFYQYHIGLFKTKNLIEVGLLYFANITFIRGFFNKYLFTLVGQGWSLTVEECFYFTVPLVFWLYKKKKPLILYPIMFLGIGFLLVSVFKNLHFLGFFNSYPFMLQYTFLGRCFEFFLGICLTLILRKNSLVSTSWLPKFTMAGILGVVSCLCVFVYLKQHSIYNYGVLHPLGQGIGNFILPIFITMFIGGLIIEKSFICSFLKTNTMVLLGKSSYTFYLIHTGVFRDVFQLILVNTLFKHTNLNTDLYKILLNAILFGLLTLLSILFFKIIEEPLNKLIINIGKKKVIKLDYEK